MSDLKQKRVVLSIQQKLEIMELEKSRNTKQLALKFSGWKKNHSAALNHLDCLLDYLESEECCLLSDKLILCRLHSNIRKKESLAKKQNTLTDYFNRL
jgi:hypothetical protein